jgi:hypothetical protein
MLKNGHGFTRKQTKHRDMPYPYARVVPVDSRGYEIGSNNMTVDSRSPCLR